jgi:hypothetical protein
MRLFCIDVIMAIPFLYFVFHSAQVAALTSTESTRSVQLRNPRHRLSLWKGHISKGLELKSKHSSSVKTNVRKAKMAAKDDKGLSIKFPVSCVRRTNLIA